MEDRGSYGLGPRLDIEQLLSEAQHRWLRPAEICEILRDYQKFQITPEPPNRPPSGSLFLFDRKVLRYFRKDGHNWRKKKDGKTVKEAHEKLKVGSVDMLHCYYAHGEKNENFQRRSYWMLESDMMHIVFVHYLEVKGNRTNIGGIKETDEVISNFQMGSPSGIMDSTSPTSTLTSLCEDADSEDLCHQASSGLHAFPESAQMGNARIMDQRDSGLLNSYFIHSSPGDPEGWTSLPRVDHISPVNGDRPRESESQRPVDLATWEGVFEDFTAGYPNVPSHAWTSSTQPTTTGIMLEQENMAKGELLAGDTAVKEEFGNPLPIQSNWQIPFQDNSLQFSKWPMDLISNSELACDLDMRLFEQRTHDKCLQNDLESLCTHLDHQNEQHAQENLQVQLRDAESQCMAQSNSENDMYMEGNMNYVLPVKKSLLNVEESLKKVDSFSRWISKELGEVDNLQMQSSTGISWSTVECGTVVDDSSLSPSLSQDQLFSIIEFSPKWAYADSETEVLVLGTFLMSQPEVTKCDWSCMFGEVEVPAEVLVDGVLCCQAPPHTVGHVPFYVTCSNRLACSEVREFDYRVGSTKDVNIAYIYGGSTNEMLLHLRLERILSQRSYSPGNHIFEGVREKRNLISRIILLKEEEESYQMPDQTPATEVYQHEAKELLLQNLMKEKLYTWLVHKVTEDGKRSSTSNDEGQCVLHLAAALGYDWAIKPILAVGVSINFRDVGGWTALHWAAFYGREQMVAVLVSLGAAPGALTDPSLEFPLGRTPADLASGNGHKGISGFLAESSLTSYLESLTMNDANEDGATEASGTKAVQTVSERTATPMNDGDVPDVLSLKDSLTAVCNATQAADRIHQMFRMQSFQRKQLSQYGDDEFGISDEHAISLLAAKTRKPGQNDGLSHAAATQIQKKFRGWKKRKEFLFIRQRIVKIQAHVRGHQVRKQYRAVIWSVGILEKVILRWRRKGSGLRGFRRDALTKNPDPECMPSKEDDYDFLKEGRKQTEERLQKALTRVKSMVQYPEARAQYRRLLTVVEGFRETKACDMTLNSTEETSEGDEDLIDIDSLLDDDTFMSIALE